MGAVEEAHCQQPTVNSAETLTVVNTPQN